jgi:hypothetical protein
MGKIALVFSVLMSMFIVIAMLVVFEDSKAKDCKPSPLKEEVFSKPYILCIVDEHEVQCISKDKRDTVTLYLEVSYRLSEEWMIYIKKK